MSAAVSNLLLSAMGPLPQTMSAKLHPVAMPIRTMLYDPQRQPRYVHFITSGIVSQVITMSPGEGVEVGIIGREGLPEATYLLGDASSPTQCFMQVEGTALRMGFQDFQQLFLQDRKIARQVLRYVQYESFVSMQLSGCARLHSVEERLSRWLLMVMDRVESAEIHLTQEFLADMIGARRSSVTLAAGSLQRAGLIDYRRGLIHINNREGLESAACECYPVVRKLRRGLIGELHHGDGFDSGFPAGSPGLRQEHGEDGSVS